MHVPSDVGVLVALPDHCALLPCALPLVCGHVQKPALWTGPGRTGAACQT
jgi:hypothetical protein